jgi:hypothetical protein
MFFSIWAQTLPNHGIGEVRRAPLEWAVLHCSMFFIPNISILNRMILLWKVSTKEARTSIFSTLVFIADNFRLTGLRVLVRAATGGRIAGPSVGRIRE